MTRLERLAKLRVKLATIERTKAGARVGQLDGRARQVAGLRDGYDPEPGFSAGSVLAARGTFADRLSRTGEKLARDVRDARLAALETERDVHRAEKTVERVRDRVALDARGASRRQVRPTPKEGL